ALASIFEAHPATSEKTQGELTKRSPAIAKPEKTALLQAERHSGIRPGRFLNLVDIEIFCGCDGFSAYHYPCRTVGLTRARDRRKEGCVGFHKHPLERTHLGRGAHFVGALDRH